MGAIGMGITVIADIYAHVSKSNTDYWNTKIQRNQERDKRNIEQLEKDGWKVIVLWECEIKDNFEEKSKYILSFL